MELGDYWLIDIYIVLIVFYVKLYQITKHSITVLGFKVSNTYKMLTSWRLTSLSTRIKFNIEMMKG